MSRESKGARLYLRKGRVDSKSKRRLPDVYFIRDGSFQIGTGCDPERLREAEQALQHYLAHKLRPPVRANEDRTNPEKVLVADVLALYADERAPQLASDPRTTAGFVKNLLDWWGDKCLAEVKRSTCRQYVVHRTSQQVRAAKRVDRPVSDQTARRELEMLSSAIGYWNGEDQLSVRPEVWLPEKAAGPRDALTRSEAAALLWASMGWRRHADGSWTRLSKSARSNRAHLRRFILMALYTGTRHNVLTRLVWHKSAFEPWVDVDAAVIFRRGSSEKEQRNKRRPSVNLPNRLAAHLKRWRRLDSLNQHETSCVVHHGGSAISGKIRTGFASCVRDAGLAPEITPHWLRHTAATWLVENGADAWEAAGYLGMTMATLEKHYGHHRPDHQKQAARAIAGRRAA